MLVKRNTDIPTLSRPSGADLAYLRKTQWSAGEAGIEDGIARWSLHAVSRHVPLIVLLMAVALAVTVEVAQFVTPLYTATAKIYVQPIAGGSLGIDMPRQRDLVTSTPVVAAALADEKVRGIDALRGRHDALTFVQRKLAVDIDSDNRLIFISFDATAPGDGVAIVSAVVDAYMRFESSLRKNANADVVETLRDEKKKREEDLARKSVDALKFAEDHELRIEHGTIFASDDTVQRLADSLGDAHFEAIKAQADAEDLDRALKIDPERAKRMADYSRTPSGQQAASEDPELIRRERNILKSRALELEQKFMPGHPALVGAQKKLAELEVAMDVAVKGHLVKAKQREANLQHVYDQERAHALEQADYQAEYVRRKESIAQAKSGVDTLTSRLLEMDSSDTVAAPALTLLDPAQASDSPTSPNYTRLVLIALGGGLAMGVILACVSEAVPAGREVKPNQRSTGLPVLSELPPLPTHFGPMGDGQRILAAAGPAADAMRRLHLIVQSAVTGGRGVTVLVTSPARGDGKSTLASNLAVSLALTRKRVVLVDGDFRNRAMARLFGINDATGLGTLLDAAEPIVVTGIHHTGTPSLHVVPCGPTTRNPAEILNTTTFTDILGDLCQRYDYVIIDSPPTVTFSDARIVAASCDLTFMVIRSRNANRRLYETAKEGLTHVGANLAGMVVNHFEEPAARTLSDPKHASRTFRSASISLNTQ